MAPLLLPPTKTEKFLISGLGSLVFTEEQRASCLVSLTVEKVRPTNPDGSGVVIPSYFNNKYPEPQSHWGYFHLMRRDFVSRTGPLEYRRQVLLDYDRTEVTILSRLRCLLEKEHDHRDAVDETILGSLGSNLPPGGEPNINELKAIWNASVESQLFPTLPETALWYQLADGWSAQLFLSWQAFPPMNCGVEYQQAPPPRVPGQGESGPPGEREPGPIPPGRQTDPLSDLPSPPADSSSPPPVPEAVPASGPGPGRTRFFLRHQFAAGVPDCSFSTETFEMGSAPGRWRASDVTATVTGTLPNLQCGQTRFLQSLDVSRVVGYSGFVTKFSVAPAPPVVVAEYSAV